MHHQLLLLLQLLLYEYIGENKNLKYFFLYSFIAVKLTQQALDLDVANSVM